MKTKPITNAQIDAWMNAKAESLAKETPATWELSKSYAFRCGFLLSVLRESLENPHYAESTRAEIAKFSAE